MGNVNDSKTNISTIWCKESPNPFQPRNLSYLLNAFETSCIVSMYRSTQFPRQVLSLLLREAPGLVRQMLKHFSCTDYEIWLIHTISQTFMISCMCPWLSSLRTFWRACCNSSGEYSDISSSVVDSISLEKETMNSGSFDYQYLVRNHCQSE